MTLSLKRREESIKPLRKRKSGREIRNTPLEYF
jgi:hypothetical protein